MRGELFGDERGEFVAFLVGFAHGEAADGKAVERVLAEEGGALFAQVAVAGTLNNAEEGLRGVAARGQRAHGPTVCQFHGGAGLGVGRGGGDALVEYHHDVAADGALHGDAGLGREQMGGAVHVTLEERAVLVHGAGMREGKYLEAARVGEHGAVPVHEAVDAAEFLKNRGAGAKQEVVGVGEEDAGSGGFEGFDGLGFNRGLGAHGHENGGLHGPVQGVKRGGAGTGAGSGGVEGEWEPGHGGWV